MDNITKIIPYILVILFTIICLSCGHNKSTDNNIEIFYRDISNSGRTQEKNGIKAPFKTEIIYITEDGNGYQILDLRPKEDLQQIIDEKIKLIKNNIFEDGSNNIHKIIRKKIDGNNFIISILSPGSDGLHYKVNYNPTLNKLKFKQFIIDKGDSLNIIERVTDTSGIYYFELFNFPAHTTNISKRDITTEMPHNKKLSYEDEIKRQVTFRLAHVNNINEVRSLYSNNKFVIDYTTMAQFEDGNSIQKILIIDDTLNITLSSNRKNKIDYEKQIHLSSNELKSIKQLLSNCKITQIKGDSVPQSSGSYICENIYLFIKNNGNSFIGGLLNPAEISSYLTSFKTDEQVRKDCRAFSSTLNGDYELLFQNLTKRFDKLDSLNHILYAK